jgi:outer membrane receptor protein involved in Fe transport
VDLSLKQKITDNFSLGLNVNNLTNTKEGTTLEDAIYHYKLDTASYRYGTSGDLWLRVSL